MRRILWAALVPLVAAGCGAGGKVNVSADLGVAGAVADFEQAVTEAKGNVKSAMNEAAAPKVTPDGAGGDDVAPGTPPEKLILVAVQMVASSAEELVRLASGKPEESAARSILNDAKELLKKCQSQPNGADVLRSLDQLAAKVASIKSAP